MEWSRTLRIDASLNEAERSRLRSMLCRDGVAVRFGDVVPISRTYVLAEGPQGVDPVEAAQRFTDGRWYDEAIIALAIEPMPPDALPILAQALGGGGSPAGVCACDVLDGRIVVEFQPAVSPASLIATIIDTELRRFGGYRRTTLLSPLPISLLARIAADGLQAPEIASDRILESLLERVHVE